MGCGARVDDYSPRCCARAKVEGWRAVGQMREPPTSPAPETSGIPLTPQAPAWHFSLVNFGNATHQRASQRPPRVVVGLGNRGDSRNRAGTSLPALVSDAALQDGAEPSRQAHRRDQILKGLHSASVLN